MDERGRDNSENIEEFVAPATGSAEIPIQISEPTQYENSVRQEVELPKNKERASEFSLYHVAGFVPGDEEVIDLSPGTQNAAGEGIYFTEGTPQFKFAGGERNNSQWEQPFYVVFKIDVNYSDINNWFRAKNKPMRPRFWHSKGQSLRFLNQYNEEVIDGRPCHVYSDQIMDEPENNLCKEKARRSVC